MVYFKHLRQLWAILQLLWSDLQQEKAVIFYWIEISEAGLDVVKV